MKTITVNREVRNMIKEEANEKESVNSTIKRLLENMDQPQPKLADKTRTTIHLEEEVLNHLQLLKIHPTESYNSIITRLINSKKLSTE